MVSPLQQAEAMRLALHRNGYPPVPITSPSPHDSKVGKSPALQDWTERCAAADEEMIRAWTTAYPRAGNTGILTGSIVGVDVDVPDAKWPPQSASSQPPCSAPHR